MILGVIISFSDEIIHLQGNIFSIKDEKGIMGEGKRSSGLILGDGVMKRE